MQTESQKSIISGTVTDEAGGVIARAQVELLELGKRNAVASVLTDENGKFALPVTKPGRVQVRFDARGFKAVDKKFDVKAGDAIVAEVHLPIALEEAICVLRIEAVRPSKR